MLHFQRLVFLRHRTDSLLILNLYLIIHKPPKTLRKLSHLLKTDERIIHAIQIITDSFLRIVHRRNVAQRNAFADKRKISQINWYRKVGHNRKCRDPVHQR